MTEYGPIRIALSTDGWYNWRCRHCWASNTGFTRRVDAEREASDHLEQHIPRVD